MSVCKQYLKNKPEVKLTFEISKEKAQGASNIVLLSGYNQWKPIEFKALKSGKFKLSVNVPTINVGGVVYIFKATAKEGNEFTILPDNADGYVDNGMTDGGKNAFIKIPQYDVFI